MGKPKFVIISLTMAAILLFTFCTVSVGSGRTISNGDWPMFRGDATRTGYSASMSFASSQGWNESTNNPAQSSPAVANGLVYMKGSHVFCINASTGAKVWESSVASGQDFSSPVVIDGYVYVASDSVGDVYALNASTGIEIWSFPTGSSLQSTPAFANGVVYIGLDNCNVYAINAYTGQKIWTFLTEGTVLSSPAVVDGYVYVGSNDGNVYALNATSGNKIWNYTTGVVVKYPFASSPALANGLVYIGSDNSGVYALNATTGTEAWYFPTSGPSGDIISSPAVDGDYVYIETHPYIYAVNASTGTQIWNFTTFLQSGFLAPDNEVSSPALANGVVYINSADFNLYALNASTGAKIGNFTIIPNNLSESIRFSSPAVAGNMVFVGIDNTLFAIEVSSFVSSVSSRVLPLSDYLLILSVIVVIAILAVAFIVYNKKMRKSKKRAST